MRRVFLYGRLAKEFGPVITVRANTLGAIIKLLEANHPGKFVKSIMNGYYRVVAGKSLDDEEGIQFDDTLIRSKLNLGSKDVHIMPVAQGAGGFFRVVLGILLIAAAFYFAPAAGLGASLSGIAGTTFGLTYSSIAMFGVSLLLGGIAQMLTPVPTVGGYGGRNEVDERPSFLFNGAVNTTEQGGPVPVIYGRMRVGSTVISGGIQSEQLPAPDGGAESRKHPIEAPNTLRNNSTARITDLIGEGVMGGLVNGAQSIYFDDTPLENADGTRNFSGVSWDVRLGYPDQDYMPGFSDVEAEQVVETPLTRQLGSVVRTIDNVEANAARARFRFPNMTTQNSKNGDIGPASVELRLEVKPSNGPYQTIDFIQEEEDRTGNTTTGSNTVAMTVTLSSRVLTRLNQPVTERFAFRYRRAGVVSWTTAESRNVEGRLSSVPNQDTPDGFISGEPAYYVVISTTYQINDLQADNYELELTDGDEISKLIALHPGGLTVQGKNTAPTEKSYRFDLPGVGPWLLRATRVTEDSTSSLLNNTTFWVSYTEIIDEKFIYPDTCYIGLTLNAQLFGNSVPSRSYDVYGREVRIPSNYDPETREYNGFWDGNFVTAWTDNPAWCLLDILTNERFGLGNVIALDQVDTSALYTIAQYCDELVPDGQGGMEPRFTMNCCINDRVDAYQVLNTMVSNFRGMVFWSSGSVSVGQDCPRDVDALVGRANVLDGEFKYSTSADRARHNSILVTWNDPSDADRPNIEIVEDNDDIARRGLRQSDVYAFGCNSRGQAHRFGRWILYSENNEIETVSYRASLDHLNCIPGWIVNIQDPSVSGANFAGRTLEVDDTLLVLDREVALAPGEEYEILVVDDTGKTQRRTIVTLSGQTTDEIMINAPFDPVPTKGKMWSINGTDVEARPFRVVGIVEVEPNIFEVNAIEHNPSKFDFVDRDLALEPVNITRFTSGQILPPTGLDIRETLFNSNNQLRTRVSLSWVGSVDTRAFLYKIVWKLSANGPAQEKFTSTNSAEILDLEPGIYDFMVFSIAASGESQALQSLEHEIFGKTAPPGDVTGLIAERRVNGVQLSWDVVTDLDLVGYVVRKGASWENSEYVADIVGTTMFVTVNDASDTTFLVRAKDQLDILSEETASVISSVIPPDTPLDFTVVPQADYVLFRWTRVEGVDNSYEIRRGVSWLASELIGVSSGDEFLTLDPIRTGDTTYWIKAKSTAGLYSDEASGAAAPRDLIQDRNIVIEYDNQNDGGAGSYTGWSYDMEAGPDDTLVLEEIAPGTYKQAGEHYYYYDLGSQTRARHWMEVDLVNLVGGGSTWEDFEFAWNDPNAAVPWLHFGDIEGIQLTKVIAWTRDPLDEELYGFTYQDTTDSQIGSVTADVEVNVTYDMAKFGNGLFIQDITQVSYTVTLPDVFTYLFKLRIEEPLDNKRVFMVLKHNASGDRMEVGFDAALGGFYLSDSEGNLLILPFNSMVTGLDFLTIAVVQNTDKRTLYYKSERSYSSEYVEAATVPLDNAFDRVYLYNAA